MYQGGFRIYWMNFDHCQRGTGRWEQTYIQGKTQIQLTSTYCLQLCLQQQLKMKQTIQTITTCVQLTTHTQTESKQAMFTKFYNVGDVSWHLQLAGIIAIECQHLHCFSSLVLEYQVDDDDDTHCYY